MRSERLAQGCEEDSLRCMALQLDLYERCEVGEIFHRATDMAALPFALTILLRHSSEQQL